MALAQGLTAIIIFWAIVGGLGASLLLPAMQSLIHGNFEGAAQRQAYALVGAAAAIAAAVGPLLGGFITTYLSWRIAFVLEDVIIAVVLSGIRLVHDVEYTGSRQVDIVGAVLSVLGMGGVVLGILVWQEGGEAVGLLLALGAVSLGLLAWWLVRRKRAGKAVLLDPDLFKAKLFKFGVSGQLLQQIGLGGTMIALPIYLQIVLEYSAMGAGLSIAPLSLSMFAVALVAGRRGGKRRPASLIRAGFALFTLGMVIVEPIVPRATSGWYLAVPLIIAGAASRPAARTDGGDVFSAPIGFAPVISAPLSPLGVRGARDGEQEQAAAAHRRRRRRRAAARGRHRDWHEDRRLEQPPAPLGYALRGGPRRCPRRRATPASPPGATAGPVKRGLGGLRGVGDGQAEGRRPPTGGSPSRPPAPGGAAKGRPAPRHLRRPAP